MRNMRYFLTLVLLQVPFFAVSSKDWCTEQCGEQKHLRCVAALQQSNSKCPKIETGFTPFERMAILDVHNRWRDYVASGLGHSDTADGDYMVFWPPNNATLASVLHDLPPGCFNDDHCKRGYFLWRDLEGQAADMRQLVWDYDLEKNAAIWASQCAPNVTRPYHCAFTKKFKKVHMNTDSTDWLFPISGGFTPFLMFMNYPDNYFQGDRVKLVRSYRPGMWDPFYALIYSKTYAIGCSKAVCDCHQDPNQFKPASKQGSITCIYGPAFDRTSSKYKIYEVDKQRCSRCPKGTRCRADARYKYLCARPEDPLYPAPIPDGRSTFPKHLASLKNLCFAQIMLLFTF